jgi:hypothetical protein
VRIPTDGQPDTEVDLGTTGGGYLLQARLNVNLPGIEREIAQALVDGAHLECPYSKATHGNINVVTTFETNSAINGAGARGKQDDASFLQDYADFLESHIESWTVTTEDPSFPGSSGTIFAFILLQSTMLRQMRIPITDSSPFTIVLRGCHGSSRQKTSRMAVSSSWCATAFASQAIHSWKTRCESSMS